MLEETTRQQYLRVMGVEEWKLRSDEAFHSIPTENEQVHSQRIELQKDTSEKVIETISKSPSIPENNTLINGLKLLNQGSKNGLLVLLSEQRKQLSSESRMLMSKMLKSVHFLPSETGFAIIGEAHNNEACSLDDVKVILVLGYEAGRQLVKQSGARVIPGSENYLLANRKVVISWHPDELLNKPEYKQQAWNDLKQLVEFFNTP